jgi:sulfur-oxidizing protein SoxA
MRRWALVLAGLALLGAAAEQRRSGYDFMSPALQAMQRDDARNPGQLWVREGETLWTRAAPNGRRCATCHAVDSLDGVAARYPASDGGVRAITLAGRIDLCRVQHLGLPAQGADGDDVLALSALLAHRSRGTPIAMPDARLADWRARGEALWRRRLGQLNLSCAQCHDERAGLSLGGATIPQAHPTGYPIYRLEWQALGSLERRLRGCVVGVRAEPFAPGADEWLALEVYLTGRAAGLPHEGVALRP